MRRSAAVEIVGGGGWGGIGGWRTKWAMQQTVEEVDNVGRVEKADEVQEQPA